MHACFIFNRKDFKIGFIFPIFSRPDINAWFGKGKEVCQKCFKFKFAKVLEIAMNLGIADG